VVIWKGSSSAGSPRRIPLVKTGGGLGCAPAPEGRKAKTAALQILPCSLSWCWRLLLEWCEKKTLLAGWCWRLLLEWCERKTLLAGWRPLEQNRRFVSNPCF
jgi:hypothetical protein